LAFVCALTGAEALNLFDIARQRPVAVDLAVRADYEMKAMRIIGSFPSPSCSNGNTI
jgi:hypothetical protein